MGGNMRFDKAKVGKILSDIRKYYKDLEEQKIRSSEELKRRDKFFISSRYLYFLL